ncbi:methyl-accepting chemotaxis protein [Alkalicoccobacillus murimartini]|uniref:Methyl-accepting chemotaxis protein n=1 Tax=Alkalicoccobacillus murimartini TaxID=171685 RepID=A0ABT9YI04_9BACI|nr:methyl-accepting chemotaxis protein [Alkalicoccobacillus murimartini]MDQ0207120.1 methyl-accepting chemotaxis protein [Alkalicoccobacillus murimartini]
MKSVRGKLILVFAIIVSLFIGFSIYSSWNTYQTNQHIEEIRKSQLPLLSAKEQMAYNIADRLALSRGYLLFDDEKYLEQFKEVSMESEELEQIVLLHSQEDEFIQALEKAKEWEEVLTFQVFGLMTDGEYDLAARIMDERSTPIANEMMETFHTLAEEERSKINDSIEAVVTSGEQLQLFTMIGAFVVLLIIIWLSFRISSMISNPLAHLAKEANLIAKGDLRGQPIPVKSKDEISVVSHSFNQMRDALKALIGTMSTMSQDVTTTADTLSGSSEQTAISAHQITAGLQSLTVTAEINSKLSTQSLDSAKGVNDSVTAIKSAVATASNATKQMDSEAVSGQMLIQQAMEQMSVIEKTVLHTAETMEKLDRRSNEIGDILVYLKDVSEQTGLLALNASIEAARAGEYGRGFAVVASEVQKLSEQSKDSAGQIEELIISIQTETKQVVVEIEKGRSEVTQGTHFMNKVVDSFQQILATVQKVYAQMEGVSHSTTSITTDMEQLHHQIGTVNDASHEHVAQSEQATKLTENQLSITREVEQLAGMLTVRSRELEKELSKFQLS